MWYSLSFARIQLAHQMPCNFIHRNIHIFEHHLKFHQISIEREAKEKKTHTHNAQKQHILWLIKRFVINELFKYSMINAHALSGINLYFFH